MWEMAVWLDHIAPTWTLKEKQPCRFLPLSLNLWWTNEGQRGDCDHQGIYIWPLKWNWCIPFSGWSQISEWCHNTKCWSVNPEEHLEVVFTVFFVAHFRGSRSKSSSISSASSSVTPTTLMSSFTTRLVFSHSMDLVVSSYNLSIFLST